MNLSVFDLFKVGIGPSSSHTVGPMAAAYRFVTLLQQRELLLPAVGRVATHLYGSLALTGRGHATDKAVLLGLSGEQPHLVDADTADATVEVIRGAGRLRLGGTRPVPFREPDDLVFHETETLPFHPNGIRFVAADGAGAVLAEETYYSVGGGFVVQEGETTAGSRPGPVPYPFTSAKELLAYGRRAGLPIADLVAANEAVWRPAAETDAGLDHVWAVMEQCMDRGIATDGILPGGLGVKRRAPDLYRRLTAGGPADPLAVFDWVSLFALAVNEENAAGGRVVTAPTNGAAGVIPAVLGYYFRYLPGATPEGGRRFLLTAAAVGMLYKRNASLSAAEVGCQGEVGVACSMAAAGLAAVMGGTNEQVENAAEIGMEHNLGLTCDPVGGLVQVPCIERNTMGAVKAVNAARLAVLHGDGTHRISLDHVIETMRRTGRDMQVQYKETSLGGLAVNRVEC